MQGLLLSKRKEWQGALKALLLAAAVALAACQAEESEFVDPGATETSANTAHSAKVETQAPEKSEKTGKVEPAAAEQATTPEPTSVTEQAEKAVETAAEAKPKPAEDMISLEELLVNPPVPEEEKTLHDLFVNAIKSPGEAGAQGALKGKTPTDVSVRVAAVRALERNLPLQVEAHQTQILKYALDEAWAAFLPVFSLSGTYSSTITNKRADELSPFQKIFQRDHVKGQKDIPGAKVPGSTQPIPVDITWLAGPGRVPNLVVFVKPGDESSYYIVNTGTGEIDRVAATPPPPFNPTTGQIVNPAAPAGATAAQITHSISNFFSKNNLKLGYIDPSGNAKPLPLAWNYSVASNKTAEDLVGTFSCSIFQQLPWGPQLQITTTPVYHNIPYDRFGNIYGRPWFSSVTGSIFLPLPGTKNFGPYSPQDASIKVAQQQREQALWDFKAQINAILREADARYLALINAIMNVDSAIKNRKSVEELAAQTAQLFGAGRTTQFGKDQVDSELLRVKQSEEAAWNAYVATSDSLVELLNMDPGTLLVPVAYSKALNERLAYEGANAAAVGLENRAELKSASAAVKISRITLKFQRQQDRPDLSFTSSITMSQTQYANGDHPGFRGTGGIGYATIGESLENVLRRDMQDESYSLTYNRSLFHRGEHARIQEAEAGLDQQKLNLRATENGVKNQVNDAVATLDASKAAVEAAKAHLDNARKAYDMTLELQKAGRITEFEMITKNQDLYTAEYALNAVLTQYKQAETQLLFAQGVLAARYPERTAPNEFDKYRLGLLRASNALQFFGEGKEKKAP